MTNTPKPIYSIKRLILPLIFVTALFWVTLFRKPPARYYGQVMGTTWSVVLANTERSNAALQEGIQLELDRINDLMSTYRPDSEISRFNRHDESVFALSSDTAFVIQS